MVNKNKEIIFELEEIKEQIKESIQEAKNLLKQVGSSTIESRAKSYWIAQLLIALDNDHDYLGGAGCTMQDTIDEISEYIDDEPDEDFDEDNDYEGSYAED